jgi:two-component system OmpR family response regulator
VIVLLVEDDCVLGDGLSRMLENWGFDVTLALTGAYAISALSTNTYDLVLLDLELPDMDGRQVLRRLRAQKSAIPVLILTACDGLNDRVNGLELGADDYMTKPFELREVEARIKALLRRCYGGFNNTISFGPLVLDISNQQLTVAGQLMVLPPRELGVLEVLLLQAQKVVSKDNIAQRLAGHTDELADNAIEVYVHRLRKRLEPLSMSIRTIRGLGYMLELKDQ